MDGRGMTNNYDHIGLAGAALGALNAARMRWRDTFWQHLDVAIELHHIRKVIVLDHRDCGAYRTFLGEAAVAEASVEIATHRDHLQTLERAIRIRHPRLEVELLLMELSGQVSVIPNS
jgi:carbonic anhydrase